MVAGPRGAVVTGSLRDKLLNVGAKVVSHRSYITSPMPRSQCHGSSGRFFITNRQIAGAAHSSLRHPE